MDFFYKIASNPEINNDITSKISSFYAKMKSFEFIVLLNAMIAFFTVSNFLTKSYKMTIYVS